MPLLRHIISKLRRGLRSSPKPIRTVEHIKYATTDYEMEYPICNNMKATAAIVQDAADAIIQLTPEQDIVLIGTGTSGAMMMVLLSSVLQEKGKTVCNYLLKKERESTHRYPVESSRTWFDNTPAVFIVDDMVHSGDTLRKILQQIDNLEYRILPGGYRSMAGLGITGLVLAGTQGQNILGNIANELGRADISIKYLLTNDNEQVQHQRASDARASESITTRVYSNIERDNGPGVQEDNETEVPQEHMLQEY